MSFNNKIISLDKNKLHIISINATDEMVARIQQHLKEYYYEYKIIVCNTELESLLSRDMTDKEF